MRPYYGGYLNRDHGEPDNAAPVWRSRRSWRRYIESRSVVIPSGGKLRAMGLPTQETTPAPATRMRRRILDVGRGDEAPGRNSEGNSMVFPSKTKLGGRGWELARRLYKSKIPPSDPPDGVPYWRTSSATNRQVTGVRVRRLGPPSTRRGYASIANLGKMGRAAAHVGGGGALG